MRRGATDAATAKRAAHFPCFDGLRAIAAITVLLHHAGFATGAGSSERNAASDFLARMDSGVVIFFLISGFLLYRPYVAAHLDDREQMPARRFYWRRLLRIFPAYWVALIGVVLFFGVSLPTWKDWAIHGSLLQVYDGKRFFHAISQSWTLATELSFYLIVPLWALLARRVARGRDRRTKLQVEVGLLVALFVIGLLFRSMLFPAPATPTWRFLMRYWLPANADLFAVGMLLAVASAALAGRDHAWRSPAARALPYVSWALGVGALWLVAKHAGLTLVLEDASPTGEWKKHLLYLAYATGLVVPAALGPQDRSVVHRFLALKPMVWLGMVSYGIYLWHQAWLAKASDWAGGQLFDRPYWDVVIPAFVGTVATATASYLLVERPFLRLKDRTWSRRPASAPTVDAVEEAVVAAQPAP